MIDFDHSRLAIELGLPDTDDVHQLLTRHLTLAVNVHRARQTPEVVKAVTAISQINPEHRWFYASPDWVMLRGEKRERWLVHLQSDVLLTQIWGWRESFYNNTKTALMEKVIADIKPGTWDNPVQVAEVHVKDMADLSGSIPRQIRRRRQVEYENFHFAKDLSQWGTQAPADNALSVPTSLMAKIISLFTAPLFVRVTRFRDEDSTPGNAYLGLALDDGTRFIWLPKLRLGPSK